MELFKWVYIVSGCFLLIVHLLEDIFIQQIVTTTTEKLIACFISVLPVVNTISVLAILFEFYKIRSKNY